MNALIPGNIRAQTVREKFHEYWRAFSSDTHSLFEYTCQEELNALTEFLRIWQLLSIAPDTPLQVRAVLERYQAHLFKQMKEELVAEIDDQALLEAQPDDFAELVKVKLIQRKQHYKLAIEKCSPNYHLYLLFCAGMIFTESVYQRTQCNVQEEEEEEKVVDPRKIIQQFKYPAQNRAALSVLYKQVSIELLNSNSMYVLLVMEELAAEIVTYHFTGVEYSNKLAKDPRFELMLMKRKKYSRINIVKQFQDAEWLGKEETEENENYLIRFNFQVNKHPHSTLQLQNFSNRSSKHVVLLVSGFLSQNYSINELWQNMKDEWPLQPQMATVNWSAGQTAMFAAKILLSMIDFSNVFQRILGGAQKAKDQFMSKLKNAKVAGKLLANALIVGYPYTCQNFSLVAFSLGTQVVFHCLKQLKRQKAFGLINNVYLMGGAFSLPTDTERRYWREQLNGVVCGKIHNAYSTKDQVLELFKLTTGQKNPIGLGPLDFEVIEGDTIAEPMSYIVQNTDVTAIANGHLKYRDNLRAVLEAMDFAMLF